MRHALCLLTVLAACGHPPKKPPPEPKAPQLDLPEAWVDPTADVPAGTPRPVQDKRAAAVSAAAQPIAIKNATIWTATGKAIAGGTIVLRGGAIAAIGDAATHVPGDARVIDGTGKFVTPGLIDAHSHIGVYAAPSSAANDDGNESTAPVTAGARAQYGYWPQDPQISRAIAGGVTTAMILPGSANLVGGRGFTVAMRPGRTSDDVAFPGAPSVVKMACGENPKRVYGGRGGPATRMGEYAAFRTAFIEARGYLGKKVAYTRAREQWVKKRARAAELDAAVPAGKPKTKAEPAPEAPTVDEKLETLAGVLRGDVLVQVHCYKASDIREMIAIAEEFGFKIRSFHHALEAYKVRDLLVARDIAINTWSDWWGFKLEAFDGIPENAALFTQQGGRATIHSDSAIGIQRLNQDAAKAMASGRAAGIQITEDQALRWITANPAWVLGIDDVTGTLETGKRADVTLWSASPFSVYGRAEVVIAGGEVTYEREKGATPSDFELGNSAAERGTGVTR
ncbi:MAG: amidohydrolase family protein [Deltaproteobacteria bacterium]|nr:amidohydrolase family protein [Deltaproteobacteria bacterium]